MVCTRHRPSGGGWPRQVRGWRSTVGVRRWSPRSPAGCLGGLHAGPRNRRRRRPVRAANPLARSPSRPVEPSSTEEEDYEDDDEDGFGRHRDLQSGRDHLSEGSGVSAAKLRSARNVPGGPRRKVLVILRAGRRLAWLVNVPGRPVQRRDLAPAGSGDDASPAAKPRCATETPGLALKASGWKPVAYPACKRPSPRIATDSSNFLREKEPNAPELRSNRGWRS